MCFLSFHPQRPPRRYIIISSGRARFVSALSLWQLVCGLSLDDLAQRIHPHIASTTIVTQLGGDTVTLGR